ncbi:hypothetical protein [Streptomyces collinus]|uniref:DUF7660 family protein n=1 Tax=Streptomyces collinus TaxID=42684 RepID=UPI0036E12464
MTTSPDHVASREDLAAFVLSPYRSYIDEGASWSNADLSAFLEALAAWIADADGWYSNAGRPMPSNFRDSGAVARSSVKTFRWWPSTHQPVATSTRSRRS